jgi:hypothetical protein
VKGGKIMATSHDIAARRIARKVKGRFRRKRHPEVKGPNIRVAVKMTVKEISQALRELGGGSGPAYIALPTKEHPKALKHLKNRKTGLMNYQGKIIKRSTRK